MLSLSDKSSLIYTPSPRGASGWYWMRWRRKWGRMWQYDVVWFSEYNPGQIRTRAVAMRADAEAKQLFAPSEDAGFAALPKTQLR